MDAKAIKEARERRGDSVTLAAGKLGVTERTWQRWESGESAPVSEVMLRALRDYVEAAREEA